MALTKSSQMKMLIIFMAFLALMLLLSSAAALVSRQDLVLKPLNLGRKLLAYYEPPNAYPGPGGGGANPCCHR
ncbi:hypothetical protein PTKIN_Ptkin09bG0214100 [Pterospermum kingtungense]